MSGTGIGVGCLIIQREVLKVIVVVNGFSDKAWFIVNCYLLYYLVVY